MTRPPTLIRDPWRRVWHFLAGDIFLALVIALLTLLLITATLLPQTPQNDPIAYSRWLSDVQQRFNNFAGLFTTLGLFSIFNSILFRLALSLLGVAAALRLIDQIDQLRARFTFPDQPVQPAVDAALELDLDQVRSKLRGYRIRSRDDRVVADQLPRSAVAAVMIYGGALLVLIGLLLGSVSDYRFDQIDVDLNQTASVGGTPYSIRLDGLSSAFDQASLTLLQQDKVLSSGTLGDADPAIESSPAIYLDRIGPALIISASDAAGKPIGLQTTADSPAALQKSISFSRDHPEGFIAAPTAGIVLQITPIDARVSTGYSVQAYQTASGNVLTSTAMIAPELLTINQTTFNFRPSAFVTASLVNQPSHYFVGLGLFCVLLGLIGQMVWPPRRIWLYSSDNRTQLSSDDPNFDPTQFGSILRGTRRSTWIVVGVWGLITIVTIVLVLVAYRRSASIASVSPALIGAWLTADGSLIANQPVRIILLSVSLVVLFIAFLVML